MPRLNTIKMSSVCAAMLSLAACSTTGERNAEIQMKEAGCTAATSTTFSVDLKSARACAQGVAGSYQKTALDLADETTGWNYLFTSFAVAAVGNSLFQGSQAAVKAIALGGGTATALDNDRGPGSLAHLYAGAATALDCVDRSAAPVSVVLTDLEAGTLPPYVEHSNPGASVTKPPDHNPGIALSQYADSGNFDLLDAQSFVADPTNAHDANLPLLNAAITAYQSAQQVAQTARGTADDPAGLVRSQIPTVRDLITGKLISAASSISAQQTVVQGAVTVQQTNNQASVANAGAQIAGGQSGSPKLTVGRPGAPPPPPPPPPPAVAKAQSLANDTRALIEFAEPFATASGAVPQCLASIPN